MSRAERLTIRQKKRTVYSDFRTDSEPYWKQLFEEFQPKSVLEIGCFDGRATVFMIENGARYIDCVDPWTDEGFDDVCVSGVTAQGVKDRFHRNTNIAMNNNPGVTIFTHECTSNEFFNMDRGEVYDMIYIDGSHRAIDVLSDAVCAWNCLKKGGIMVFDDYDWLAIDDPIGKQRPRLAIDAWSSVMNLFIEEWETDNSRQKCWIKL